MSDHENMDDLIAVLDHRTRREVLHCLSVAGNRADLAEITDFISHNRTKEGELVDPEDIALKLHHLHLPKLADIGLIEFDPVSGQVMYLPDTEMETLLERLEEVVDQS